VELFLLKPFSKPESREKAGVRSGVGRKGVDERFQRKQLSTHTTALHTVSFPALG
jgi:hypothetical protein